MQVAQDMHGPQCKEATAGKLRLSDSQLIGPEPLDRDLKRGMNGKSRDLRRRIT